MRKYLSFIMICVTILVVLTGCRKEDSFDKFLDKYEKIVERSEEATSNLDLEAIYKISADIEELVLPNQEPSPAQLKRAEKLEARMERAMHKVLE